MSYRSNTPGDDWLGAGWSAFHFPVPPGSFPPLDDDEAQHAWLTGFIAAWAECPESVQRKRVSWGVGPCGRSIAAALEAVLADRLELLRQLQAFGVPMSPVSS
jgi:hypothetical protein